MWSPFRENGCNFAHRQLLSTVFALLDAVRALLAEIHRTARDNAVEICKYV